MVDRGSEFRFFRSTLVRNDIRIDIMEQTTANQKKFHGVQCHLLQDSRDLCLPLSTWSRLLLLCERRNALQLHVFFSVFCLLYPKCRGIRSKKIFIDHQTANIIQSFVPIKRTFFGSIIFQNKLQRRGISQVLLDEHCHLFICISLKQT